MHACERQQSRAQGKISQIIIIIIIIFIIILVLCIVFYLFVIYFYLFYFIFFFIFFCNLKSSSFKSKENILRKEHGPFFEVLATQASSVTLTIVCVQAHKGTKSELQKGQSLL